MGALDPSQLGPLAKTALQFTETWKFSVKDEAYKPTGNLSWYEVVEAKKPRNSILAFYEVRPTRRRPISECLIAFRITACIFVSSELRRIERTQGLIFIAIERSNINKLFICSITDNIALRQDNIIAVM